jgi:hypothetical protein
MQKSSSMPQIEPRSERNKVPTRAPSGGGFKASFLPSETPGSSRNHREIPEPPAPYPSEYADKSQMGMSAAKITELMNQNNAPNINQWNYNTDPSSEQIQGRDSASRKKSVRFQGNAEENKSLNIEGENEETNSIRHQKRNELRDALAQQIDEQRRRRENEDVLKRKQEVLEEERIKKEMEEEERRYRLEIDREEQKRRDAMEANQQIIEDKRRNHMPHLDKLQQPQKPRTPTPDYSAYHQSNKDFTHGNFAPGQSGPEHQPPGPVNRQNRYENDIFNVAAEPAQKHHRLPNWPMRNFDAIHKDDLIKELQIMVKKNLEVEAEKLKEEFHFNQQDYTDMISKLRNESQRAIMQRNAARKELGRLNNELDYKRDYDENYGKQLMVALNRYNPANMYRPPKEDPTSIGMVAPFRGGGKYLLHIF